jgi:hypothetical protein
MNFFLLNDGMTIITIDLKVFSANVELRLMGLIFVKNDIIWM